MPPGFVSLGGVFLDEIHWPGKTAQQDVVGGSASYATLGARMFTNTPAELALILHTGNDFPPTVLEQLRAWHISIAVRHHEDAPSTREAYFTQLTKPLLPEVTDLADFGLLRSKILHLFSTAAMAHHQIEQLRKLQQTANISGQHILWEPHPKSCLPSLLADHIAVLKQGSIAVFSPNHHELASFFDADMGVFHRGKTEGQAQHMWTTVNADLRDEPLQAIIIRAADNGCFVVSQQSQHGLWLPAFWSAHQQDRIIDPTGAGNAFLGGLAQGWLETRSWIEAACYGAVAASIVVEQVGVPELKLDEAGAETWSGIECRRRLRQYMSRADVRAVLNGGSGTVLRSCD